MKFTGTKDYVATDDLKVAVNASIVLERPLLIKGEPGTGKTVLAEEVAKALGAPLLTWHNQVPPPKGATGPLRIRRGVAPARTASSVTRRVLGHFELHQARQNCGKPLPTKKRPVLLNRRDRQGRHRISQTTSCSNSIAWSFFVYETGEKHQGEPCARS